jgi:hypothetical protein
MEADCDYQVVTITESSGEIITTLTAIDKYVDRLSEVVTQRVKEHIKSEEIKTKERGVCHL